MASPRPDAVAVIGMCARFPGAPDYDAFWRNLSAGISQIREIPEDRFDWRRFYGDPQTGINKTNSKWGGFLDAIDRFDAAFFGISPREAELMDPQQRFMLEMTWHCLEDAGYAPSSLAGGRVGVYLGVCNYDYKELQDQLLPRMTGHRQMGSWTTLIPNRVSYWYNFHGPSFPIDTGCSSSLLALHEASQSLRLGECEMAIAGGVSLIASPLRYLGFGQLGMLSPTGRCWTFDAAADGYVRGEGAGLVLLKPLRKALEDGDRIHGVILGSAQNHGGKARTLTSPNAYAQSQVIVDAHVSAGVSPDTITYIEAHGTGTPMGDPIEIHGLRRAFGRLRRHYGVRTDAANYCGVGTVKTHVGHLEAAAGMAGLIGVLLAMRHRTLPGLCGFTSPNPNLDVSKSPFFLLDRSRPWAPSDAEGRPLPLRAGLSSFGAGGANAHVVLEEAPAVAPRPPEAPRPQVVVLSARTEASLRTQAGALAASLSAAPEIRLGDVSLTTTSGRDHLERRLAVVADSTGRLAESLRAYALGEAPAGLLSGSKAESVEKPVFLFTGQGSQYPGMGRALHETEPVFRRALERCQEVLLPLVDRPLLHLLFGEAAGRLDETAYTQPALFSLEFALAELWRSWGIEPAAVIGHSVGEYVAACVAGVFSLEDGLKLIAARGRLMQDLPRGGGMAAVFADEARVARAVAPHRENVSIAAVNGPGQVVISGPRERLLAIGEDLARDGITLRPLSVSHAFHSPLMRPMLPAFEAVAAEIAYREPAIPFVSNVTGHLAGREVASASYWRDHVLATVRFEDGIRALHAGGHTLFVEIGPKPTLSDLGRRCLPAGSGRWLASLRGEGTDATDLLESLAALHVEGVAVSWGKVRGEGVDRRIGLPTYPFEARRYWMDLAREGAPVVSPSKRPKTSAHPLLGERHVVASQPGQVVYASTQSREEAPGFLADHRVFGAPVLPAAAVIDLMLAALPPRSGAHALEAFEIRRPLLLQEEPRAVQCIVDREADGSHAVRVWSRPASREEDAEAGGWVLHASGRQVSDAGAAPPLAQDLASLAASCPSAVSPEDLYRLASERGLDYGPGFRAVTAASRGERAALGRVELPEGVADGAYAVHPVLLDGCLQVLLALLPGDGRMTYLPTGIRRLRLWRPAPRVLWSHVRLETLRGGLRADLGIFDGEGNVVAEIEGLALRSATRRALLPAERERWRDWLYSVSWLPRAGRGPGARPDYLPAPEATGEHLRAVAETLLPPASPQTTGLRAELDAASLACIVAAFRRNGFAFAPGERFTAEEVAASLGVTASQRKLLRRLLDVLTEEGILRAEGSGWSVARSPADEDPVRRLALLLARHPEAEPELNLLGRTGPHLGEILRGTRDPLQLMFPGGDLGAATHLYEDSLEPRAANLLVGRAVAFAVERLPKDRTLRILEIGAGTGATTASVLPVLPADRVEYLFTDVTPTFTLKAEERFRAYPFLRCGLLDIEKPPELQGVEPHSVDLVLAANVVHATRDLAQTLEHVRRLLAPGGMLLLLEGSEPRRWVDLTFGTLEGWWRFTDHDLRPHYPLIGPAQWRRLLAGAGYDAADTVELPRDPDELIYPQSLVVARTGALPEQPAEASSRRWLICADAGGVGAELASRLRASGDACTLAEAGNGFDPADPAAVRQLVRGLEAPPHGVVHLWSLDLGDGSPVTASRAGCGSALTLVQALVQSQAPPPALWVVTRGAMRVGRDDTVPGVFQSAVWGLAHAIELEHPELRCVRLDLDGPGGEGDVDALLREIRMRDADKDSHVAFRGGARYSGRLTRVTDSLPPGPVRLESASRGTLDALSWVATEREAPGPGEVEILVRACGLNFIDVMDALGLAPYARRGFGLECAGEITAVGEGVTGLRIGDEVVGVAEGCFARYVTTNAMLVVPKPANLTMAEAASIPANFLTAHYALNEIARVGPNDRVLVHAAAGGTGMAGVQLARRAGAEVWGTASAGKRALLAELGVTRVFDSRSLAFAEEMGQEVDVVLNSLAGEFIPKSLGVLRESGRFLEIGMTGVWTEAQVAAARPGVRYSTVNLFRMTREEPARIQTMLRDLMARFAAGELRPIPCREIPAAQAIDAFRTMQGAKHVGKLVISVPAAAGETSPRLDPDATYLIVGGLRGLGPLVAGSLAGAGARHLALLGRSGVHEEAREPLRALEEAGVEVRVLRGDVSRAEDVSAALAEIRGSMPPLRGIVHSAGLLDDGALTQQSWERFAFVLGPKMDGAWHLHAGTRDLPLDFFVLFSSVASLLGSAGQGNHSAANAFLDALAAHRRAQGLAALSINWGPWSGIGAAARRAEQERWSVKGMEWISPAEGLEALEALFRYPEPQIGVAPVTDWSEFLASRTPSSYFDAVRPARREAERVDRSLLRELEEAPPAERRARVIEHIRGEIRTVLGFDASTSLDAKVGFFDLGLDSLTSVELRNRLQATFQATLAPTVSFDHPTIAALADHLLAEVLAFGPPVADTAPPDPVPAPPRAADTGLDELSADELAELLGQELSEPRPERRP